MDLPCKTSSYFEYIVYYDNSHTLDIDSFLQAPVAWLNLAGIQKHGYKQMQEAVRHANSGFASRFGFCRGSRRRSEPGTKAISILTQWQASLVPGLYYICRTCFLPYPDQRFLEHTSSRNVIATLTRLRVKLAKKRHDYVFYRNINSANRSPDSVQDVEITSLFPSRRQWVKLGKSNRGTASPIERNKTVLNFMIQKHFRSGVENPEWFERLQERADSYSRQMQKARQGRFCPPEIKPASKKGSKNIFRPIAEFNLADRIRIGATATYIREKLEPVFLPYSYAFRAKNPKTGFCPTHHDAVKDLIAFRKKFSGQTLYVAECDIQKFFDILNHKEILRAFYRLARDLEHMGGGLIDGRALQVFRNYLKCYTYKTAQDGARKTFAARGLPEAKLDEPKVELLKPLYPVKNISKERYGVPQGGALSPVIANIMLHQADKDILAAYGGLPADDLFYARYCDDMIIVHPDKEVCQKLLNVYTTSLARMKLLVHEPQEFKKYNKNFYNVKSKRPYSWTAESSDRSTVPWVSFVGYQVRHDGSLRVREASIDKEIEKQQKIAAYTIQSIKKKNVMTDKSAGQIIYRLQCKLSSMATGKRYKNSTGPCDDMCWGNGFKLLIDHPFPAKQISRLDRAREKAVKSVQYALAAKKVRARNETTDEEPEKDLIEYFGYPFSYSSAFSRKSQK